MKKNILIIIWLAIIWWIGYLAYSPYYFPFKDPSVFPIQVSDGEWYNLEDYNWNLLCKTPYYSKTFIDIWLPWYIVVNNNIYNEDKTDNYYTKSIISLKDCNKFWWVDFHDNIWWMFSDKINILLLAKTKDEWWLSSLTLNKNWNIIFQDISSRPFTKEDSIYNIFQDNFIHVAFYNKNNKWYNNEKQNLLDYDWSKVLPENVDFIHFDTLNDINLIEKAFENDYWIWKVNPFIEKWVRNDEKQNFVDNIKYEYKIFNIDWYIFYKNNKELYKFNISKKVVEKITYLDLPLNLQKNFQEQLPDWMR